MSRPFVRVYHDDFPRDYPAIYADDAALAAWLRLLVIADKMWPAPPELPRSVKPGALAKLTEAGLVKLVPPHGFRVKGYDNERQARNDAARNAAALRWQSKGNATAYAGAMPTPVPVPVPDPVTNKNGVNPREKTTTSRGGLEPVASILPRVR